MVKVKASVRFAAMVGVALAASMTVAEARDIKVQRKESPAATQVAKAPAAIAASAPVTWTAAPVKSAEPTTTAEAAPAVPACARKVKVIYAGYGEANRAATCAPDASAPTS